jgi:glycerophosphoryl diester phosphodiesterase
MKKETIKKEKVIKEVKLQEVIKEPKLISYEIKAIISIGQYSNIQPSITVQASSIEEAQAYTMPYIDELFKKYLNSTENKIEIKPTVKVTPKPLPVVQIEVTKDLPEVVLYEVKAVPVQQTLVERFSAFANAEKAIASCYSLPALKSIDERIQKSEKLTAQEKLDLNFNLTAKENDIKYNQK